ncbi:PelB Pectate lyase [Pyrenophora tritici-repentis]|uniref:pectin lyase n=2 Tax=Pyrenophora tritici-repentis TaxID=45151 RepID=A0A2W1FUR6_9PLEO|nr:pectin lyase A precursor [Pyrenophora tritici-repentis Pt-1C-BFP]KAA8620023.1 Polysaccharide lyase family 1 protein [Pyrenophora tritici-repentis]EDU46757.1 pectin lyase A precursor [Pyrenophora tritici-repentis Pt-1C-BFP]KAF7448177.1 Polysaccharide lyase family 1 protein [Pyrenophora tritici-repentis]KAF7571888.1 PelB, Pectate lyase [Pyrenophora tritici-repentis]KAG9384920.1 Polysaccharide lyase family 1 protein [Pyrenophora tritici-repentis]
MKYSLFAAVVAAFASGATAADAVKGAAEGFAKGVTGGGNAAPVYPTTTAQLISYLGDASPRVIVLTKTFDFTGTEGKATSSGCRPWGTGSNCQIAINQNGWCDNYQKGAPKVGSITYDKAGVLGITVKSNKSLIGQGSKGVIKGKGIRMTGGVKNIIIQNVRFTEINPQYVWGGDAITVDGADLIWIDHVTTDLIARQHIVLGNTASGRVTISNNEINGATAWSATCDGHHYWGLYLTGSNDLVTLKGNYIHHTSGRSPKVAGNTLLHAVNNYFSANSGHAFEADAGAKIVAEGNVFQDVKAASQSGLAGKFFASASNNAACKQYLGHNCEPNAYGNSAALAGADTSILSGFSGKSIASAGTAASAKNVVNTAGYGRI